MIFSSPPFFQIFGHIFKLGSQKFSPYFLISVQIVVVQKLSPGMKFLQLDHCHTLEHFLLLYCHFDNFFVCFWLADFCYFNPINYQTEFYSGHPPSQIPGEFIMWGHLSTGYRFIPVEKNFPSPVPLFFIQTPFLSTWFPIHCYPHLVN